MIESTVELWEHFIENHLPNDIVFYKKTKNVYVLRYTKPNFVLSIEYSFNKDNIDKVAKQLKNIIKMLKEKL